MYGLLNLGSLFFGLVAWAIPVLILIKKKDSKNSGIKGIFFSFVSTIISLFMQVLYTKFLVDSNDWSALLDTQGGVIFAASVLLIIVIVLNGLVMFRSLNRNFE